MEMFQSWWCSSIYMVSAANHDAFLSINDHNGEWSVMTGPTRPSSWSGSFVAGLFPATQVPLSLLLVVPFQCTSTERRTCCWSEDWDLINWGHKILRGTGHAVLIFSISLVLKLSRYAVNCMYHRSHTEILTSMGLSRLTTIFLVHQDLCGRNQVLQVGFTDLCPLIQANNIWNLWSLLWSRYETNKERNQTENVCKGGSLATFYGLAFLCCWKVSLQMCSENISTSWFWAMRVNAVAHCRFQRVVCLLFDPNW